MTAAAETTVAIAAAPAAAAAQCGDAAKAVRAFLGVQAERASLYARLQAGFKAYVAAPTDEARFAEVISGLTGAFNGCSRAVIGLEAQLNGPLARPDLGRQLRAVQESERDKLQLTMAWQALKGPFLLERFSWQRGQDSDGGDEDLLGGGPTGAAGYAGAGGHGHGCGCCAGGAAGPPEPTRAEYDAAIKELNQGLDRCIRAINEVIEELRDEVAEAL